MMDLASKQDIAAMTALWHVCFGDSPGLIAGFWNRMFAHIRVYTAREQGSVAAMVCALPATLVDESGESFDCSYLYAVCTHPHHRGRGLCTRLLAYAEQQEAGRGAAFAALVPEGAEKFEFYEKRGYQTAFYHARHEVKAGGKAKITAVQAEAYDALRQMQLYGSFLSYEQPFLACQELVAQVSGGGLFRIETADMVCCAAAERNGSRLVIKELLPYDETAAAALVAHLGCSSAEVRSDGGDLPFGMLKALENVPLPERAYLGLALD